MGQVLTQNIQVERSTKQQVQTVVVHSSSGSFKSTISVSKEPQLSNFNDSLSLIMTALSFIDMEWCSMSLFTAISIDQSFLQCSQTKINGKRKLYYMIVALQYHGFQSHFVSFFVKMYMT